MADYYVRTDGSNSNDGLADSAGGAWLTLSYALSQVAAGDTVHVGAGTFADGSNASVTGTSESPITVRGSGAGSTIISGAMTLDAAWYNIENMTFDNVSLVLEGSATHDINITGNEFKRGLQGVNMDNVDGGIPYNITIDGCEFHHPRGNGMVECVGNTSVIKNCTFRDNAGYDAIRIFGDDNEVCNNTFIRIVSVNTETYFGASTTSVSIGTGTKTLTVPSGLAFTANDRVRATSAANTANYFYGWVTSYSGTTIEIDSVGVSGSGTFSDFTVALDAKDNPYDSGDGNHADIIQSFKNTVSTSTKRLKFHSNRIEDCTSQFGNLENDAANTLVSDWLIYNNLFVNSRITLNNYTPNLSFFNNTVYDTGDNTIGIRAANSGGTKGAAFGQKVCNNIFCRIGGTESGGGAYNLITGDETSSADYNVITDSTDTDFTDLEAGENSFNGGHTPAELFADPNNDDFTLAVGSVAIGAGVDLSDSFTLDILGATRVLPWDIGAYEFDGVSVPSAPTNLTVTAI